MFLVLSLPPLSSGGPSSLPLLCPSDRPSASVCPSSVGSTVCRLVPIFTYSGTNAMSTVCVGSYAVCPFKSLSAGTICFRLFGNLQEVGSVVSVSNNGTVNQNYGACVGCFEWTTLPILRCHRHRRVRLRVSCYDTSGSACHTNDIRYTICVCCPSMRQVR